MTNNVIETSHVGKRFGDIEAVVDVSLSIPKGCLFGLIGHNGAGKSTLFKMMLGLLSASQGEIRIDGQRVDGDRFREVRRSIGYLPENVVFYGNLTGMETLQFFARLKGASDAECIAALERTGLRHAENRRVQGYSKGMRQRLGFAQALLGRPALLFLDEPTNGLDAEAIREFYQTLHEIRQQGVTVVLTSHILAEIQERVDRLAILKSGRLQAEGTVQQLREQVDLPLRVVLQTKNGATAMLRQKLGELGAAVYPRAQNYLDIEIQRADKMRLLTLVSAMSAEIGDIQIREPSLEDVFLGYAHVPAAANDKQDGAPA